MQRLLVSQTSVGTAHVFSVAGEVDMENAEALHESFAHAKDDPIVVSLRDIRYIDSSGLAVLVREHNRRKTGLPPLIVVLPKAPADRVFTITQLDRFIRCFREIDEALAAAAQYAVAS